MNNKEWRTWLKEHMTEEHLAKLIYNYQRAIAEERYPVAHYQSVTSGSNLPWPVAGSPLPPGGIPEPTYVSKIQCWYCGGANHVDRLKCVYCEAPLREE